MNCFTKERTVEISEEIFNVVKNGECKASELFQKFNLQKFAITWSNSSLRNSLLNNPSDEIQGLQRFSSLIDELNNPNISNPKLYSFIKSE